MHSVENLWRLVLPVSFTALGNHLKRTFSLSNLFLFLPPGGEDETQLTLLSLNFLPRPLPGECRPVARLATPSLSTRTTAPWGCIVFCFLVPYLMCHLFFVVLIRIEVASKQNGDLMVHPIDSGLPCLGQYLKVNTSYNFLSTFFLSLLQKHFIVFGFSVSCFVLFSHLPGCERGEY